MENQSLMDVAGLGVLIVAIALVQALGFAMS